jgi:hypothetical protein
MDNLESMDLNSNEGTSVNVNHQEKNMNKLKMDSTPISDIMGSPDVMDAQGQQIPNFTQLPQHMDAAPPAPTKRSNPGNLTDEQIEAIFAGAIAVMAFSKPVQSKLANSIPNFMGEGGDQSTTGLAATAVVAAILFYFGKRFVLPQ